MNKHKTIGIDLAKSSCYLVTLSPQGKREGKTKPTRPKLLNFMIQQPVCTVAMEACASSHYWAREIQWLVCLETDLAAGQPGCQVKQTI